MSLAKRARELRKNLGLTQNDVARAVDVDPSEISQIETARIKQPSLDIIRALARVLETTPDDLLSAMLGGSPTPDDSEDVLIQQIDRDPRINPVVREVIKGIVSREYDAWKNRRQEKTD